MAKRIGFEDLTLPLRILVTLGWVYTGFWVLSFILGFIAGVRGYY